MSASGAKREILAAGIMIFRIMGEQIEYLLLQASNLNHHWTPPKGKLDPGEDYMTAAQRETEEESGLKPSDYDIIPDFKTTLEYEAWNKHKTVVYWTARVKNPDVPITISDEHMNFQWCNLPTLTRVSSKENMTKAFNDLEIFLQKKYFSQKLE